MTVAMYNSKGDDMKITAINKKGKKLTIAQLERLANHLNNAFDNHGFITTASVVNSSRIDIKHSAMSYARINTIRRGYNYRVNTFTMNSTKTGYKRTSVLSWGQRVELNNLINYVLDVKGLDASIRSGGYLVRSKVDGAVTYWEVPFMDHLSRDSFQLNMHDWIYESPRDAAEAICDTRQRDYHQTSFKLYAIQGGK